MASAPEKGTATEKAAPSQPQFLETQCENQVYYYRKSIEPMNAESIQRAAAGALAMHFPYALVISMVLGVCALFFFFAAAAQVAYPGSRVFGGACANEARTPRRWSRVFLLGALAVLFAVSAAYVFGEFSVPAQRLAEAEAITYSTFEKKLGRKPSKLQLEEDGRTEYGRLKYKGLAWLGDDEIWNVRVVWGPGGWECSAGKKQ
jgi:hypothetical protein